MTDGALCSVMSFVGYDYRKEDNANGYWEEGEEASEEGEDTERDY